MAGTLLPIHRCEGAKYRRPWHIPPALQNVTGERAAEVLPALELLFLENGPVRSVKDFVVARQNMGRHVTVIYEERVFPERLNTLDASE